jgi:hypothetical protein
MSGKSIHDSIRQAKAAAGALTTEAASELFCDQKPVRQTAVDDDDDLPPSRGTITTWLNVTPDGENGGAKVGHGSGGIGLLRAA